MDHCDIIHSTLNVDALHPLDCQARPQCKDVNCEDANHPEYQWVHADTSPISQSDWIWTNAGILTNCSVSQPLTLGRIMIEHLILQTGIIKLSAIGRKWTTWGYVSDSPEGIKLDIKEDTIGDDSIVQAMLAPIKPGSPQYFGRISFSEPPMVGAYVLSTAYRQTRVRVDAVPL